MSDRFDMRGKYIEAFFSNINWDVVEERLKASTK